jgi:heme oxygenase
MEGVMASGDHPMCACLLARCLLTLLSRPDTRRAVSQFTKTGLERGQALAQDIAWFEAQGMRAPSASGAGVSYATYLRQLALKDPQSFLCHWYNVYFAHTAGGRMIGAKVASMLELPASMAFYAWEGDLNAHMTQVRESINSVAEGWSREEKDRCLGETQKSFELSGQLLRLIAG